METTSSDFNFMSLEGLAMEDQQKLQSILFGAEKEKESADGAEAQRRELNVHAQEFVPKSISSLPLVGAPLVHYTPAMVQHAPLTQEQMMHQHINQNHMFQNHVQALHAQSMGLNMPINHMGQHVPNHPNMPHDNGSHQHFNHHQSQQQQQLQQIQQLQQQHQQQQQQHLQQQYRNDHHHYRPNRPPRYQNQSPRYANSNTNNMNNGQSDGRGHGRGGPNSKRITVLQNPNSRRYHGNGGRHNDGQLPPRFHRERDRSGYHGGHGWRHDPRHHDQDINSNMLKLQNGLEPKYADPRSSPDESDDERRAGSGRLNFTAPSVTKWPDDDAKTCSSQSRSLSPASSAASEVRSPPSTKPQPKPASTNHGIDKQRAPNSIDMVRTHDTSQWSASKHDSMADAQNRSSLHSRPSKDERDSADSSDSLEGVEVRVRDCEIVDDEWTQEFGSSKPSGDWSGVEPELPWSATGFNAAQHEPEPVSADDSATKPAPRTETKVPDVNPSMDDVPKPAEAGSGIDGHAITKPDKAVDRPTTSAATAAPAEITSPAKQATPEAASGNTRPVENETKAGQKSEESTAGPNAASAQAQKPLERAAQAKEAPAPMPGTCPAPVPPPASRTWASLVSSNLPPQPAVVFRAESPPEAKSDQTAPAAQTAEEEEENEVGDLSQDRLVKRLREYLSTASLHHRPPSVYPRGLINRSNWCYVNATLQALLACPPFYNLFKNLPRLRAKDRGHSCTPVIDSICEYVHEFTFMKPLTNRNKIVNKKQEQPTITPQEPFEPHYVYKMLMKLKSTDAFKQGRQEDAEEFLTCVLNHMHDELLAVTEDRTKAEPEEAAEDSSADWEQVGRKKKAVITRSNEMPRSLVSDIFCGQIRSVLRSSGSRESATLEPFFTLPLDIQNEKIRSVKDALAGLVSRESIQGFTCSKTKEEVEATRCTMLELLPPVLILHLKCFIYDKNGGCQKLGKEIEYTVDLEINKEIISPNARAKIRDHQRSYKLFAVVYHRGKTLQGGHYTTDVYHSGINGWIRIDDHNISVVPVSQVMQYAQPYMPYLLYYRRHDSLGPDRRAEPKVNNPN